MNGGYYKIGKWIISIVMSRGAISNLRVIKKDLLFFFHVIYLKLCPCLRVRLEYYKKNYEIWLILQGIVITAEYIFEDEMAFNCSIFLWNWSFDTVLKISEILVEYIDALLNFSCDVKHLVLCSGWCVIDKLEHWTWSLLNVLNITWDFV